MDKNNIKNTIIVAVLLIIYSILTKGYAIFLLLNNIITIAMIIVFIYVNIIRTRYVDRTFMKGVRLSYLMLIIIIILNIIGLTLLFSYMRKIDFIFVFMFSVQASLECCFIEKFFQLEKKYSKSLIICISYCILFAMLFYVCKINFTLHSNYKLYLLILSVVISIGTCISTLEKVIRNRRTFLIYEFRKIVLYICSILIYYVGLFCLIMGYKEITEVIIFIKGITFYKFYNYIVSRVLDNSLIKINDNIKIATKTKRELNSILKKRNSILNEANIMLKKSQDENNKLIDSIYGGVFLFYNDKLQDINKNTLETLNIKNDEVFGMELDEFIKKYFYITLDDLKYSRNHITFAKMKDSKLDVEIFLTYVDENSKILYVHDISEINENILIKKVLKEYLEEEKIKKEFFANISHELKTPINLIFAALQVNQIYLDEKNISGFNRNRKIIKQNCLRLIRTINNFIDANKISEGYLTPDYKLHNMVELVENISIAANKYIQLIDNTLTFDADNEEIYVRCDKDMITRIILNILSNSVKYGKEGGNINVRVCIYKNEYVMIKVENDGLEIDKETIPYIFDKFTKMNKAFNRLKEGSGLGLFLTKALIELQGGNINLISNSNGNEFIITMPRVIETCESELIYEEWETNQLEEKIDVEFSDIYID